MVFEDLIDRLTSLYDVSQTRAVAVANERLERMVTESKSLRAIKSLGTTVANQTSYSLDPTIIQVYKVRVDFTAGTAIYEGTESIDAFWQIDAGNADTTGYFYAIEPDTDSLGTTDNLRLYPAPSEAGKAITGLVAIRPAVLTYTSNTPLPISLDMHEALLAGAKAELSDEEQREDESAKFEQVFAGGISRMHGQAEARGKGTNHRIRVVGYDVNPHSSPYAGC